MNSVVFDFLWFSAMSLIIIYAAIKGLGSHFSDLIIDKKNGSFITCLDSIY